MTPRICCAVKQNRAQFSLAHCRPTFSFSPRVVNRRSLPRAARALVHAAQRTDRAPAFPTDRHIPLGPRHLGADDLRPRRAIHRSACAAALLPRALRAQRRSLAMMAVSFPPVPPTERSRRPLGCNQVTLFFFLMKERPSLLALRSSSDQVPNRRVALYVMLHTSSEMTEDHRWSIEVAPVLDEASTNETRFETELGFGSVISSAPVLSIALHHRFLSDDSSRRACRSRLRQA